MAKISAHIVYNDEILLDIRQNIVSADVGCLDRGNADDFVDNHIFANTGRISFIDFERKILPIYEQSIIDKCEVRIFVSANYGDERLKVATFDIDDFSYDYETLLVTLELKDKLLSLQDQNVSYGLNSAFRFDGVPLADLIKSINCDVSIMGYALSNILNVFVDCYYDTILTTKVWDFLRKIGEASMTNCFSDQSGVPCFGSAITQVSSGGSPITIRPHNIKSVVDYTRKDKTKIPYASLSVIKRIKNKGGIIGTPIYKTLSNAYFSSNEALLEGVSISANSNNSQASAEIAGNNVSLQYTIKTDETIYSLRNIEVTGRYITGTSVNNDGKFPYWNLNITDDKNTYARALSQSITSNRHEATVKTSFFSIREFGGNYINLYTDVACKILGYSFKDDGEESYSYGKGNHIKNLPTNDIMQTGNRYGSSREKNYSEEILNLVKLLYADGLECVELECDFSDYRYYYTDALAYSQSLPSVNQICFKKYDMVVPFIVRNGVEVPFSSLPDGSPKVFSVIGIKYKYNGRLTQNLVLQEVPQQYNNMLVITLEAGLTSKTVTITNHNTFTVNGIDGLTDAVESIVYNDDGTITINYQTDVNIDIVIYYTTE